MSARCPQCGAETVLLHEWRQDVTHCVACGARASLANTTEFAGWLKRIKETQGDTLTNLLLALRKLHPGSPSSSVRPGLRKALGYVLCVAAALGADLVLRAAGRVQIPSTEVWVAACWSVAAAAIAAAVTLPWWQHKLHRRMLERGELTTPSSPEEIGDFILTYVIRVRLPGALDAASPAFAGASSSFTRDHGDGLTPRQQFILCLMLNRRWGRGREEGLAWNDVVSACRVLGCTDYVPALWPLGQLAAGSTEGVVVPDEVRSAASAAAEAIRARVLGSAAEKTLLRSSAPDADTDSLLRPATQGEEPPEQLLRPTGPDG